MPSNLLGNHIHLQGKDDQPRRRVIITKKEKEAVLTEMHAGHFGGQCMRAKINLRFFWCGIVKDVDSWTSEMTFCLSITFYYM